ncbi:MAG TPA: maleylacetate reductase [Hyphomicrobiales bacterium]|nr:maleylacetate reductase [Hyphomicrobiales bacterium]
MEAFVYNSLPSRVIFGAGMLARLGAELERLGCRRAFLLATPQQESVVRDLVSALGDRAAGIFAGAAMHTPVDVTVAALAAFEAAGADCTVAVGGGSTTGLGKALALRTDKPQVVIPTTYAGSEMTPILGQTEGGRKTTLRSPKVLPEVVLYDVDLTLTLPPALSATSGMNAIAHAVEALYAEDRNPIVSVMAEECIAALGRALPKIVADPADKEARSDALYGAWLGGTCLGLIGMALHHKLCHVLGGSFELPHAETHTVVLPHALAYNEPAAPAAAARIARALGAADGAQALYDLAKKLGAPTSLKALGMPESGIDRAADLAVENPYWNPRPLDRAAIRGLLARAWAGERPAA